MESEFEGNVHLRNDRALLLSNSEQQVRAAHVSLYWSEKLWLLLSYAQYLALLWCMSLAWPWPADFLTWFSFVLVFNLDFAPLVQQQQLGLSASTGYWTLLHIIVVLLLPIIMLIVSVWAERRVNLVGDTMRFKLHQIRRLMFALSDFLYIPVLVALGRLFCCDSNSNQLILVPDVVLTCYTWYHYLTIIIITPIPLALLMWWPYFVYRRSKELIVFSAPAEHERFLQSRETEHVLGLTDQYIQTPIFLIASYTRRFALYHAIQYTPRFLLVANMFVLSPVAIVHYYSLSSSNILSLVQVFIFIVVFFLTLLLHFVLGLYRADSSTHVWLLISGSLTVSGFFGLLSASHFRSAFLVDSVLSVLLLCIQCVALLSILVLMVFHRFKTRRMMRTWPITFEKINLWAPDKKDLILTLRQSRVALSEAPMYPVQLYPISNVMSLKFELQQHLRTISSVQRYLLEWTVQDALSDVSRLINGVEKHTLLPNQLLEHSLAGFREAMLSKSREQVLMHPLKRAMLLKLMAARALLGDRVGAPPASNNKNAAAAPELKRYQTFKFDELAAADDDLGELAALMNR